MTIHNTYEIDDLKTLRLFSNPLRRQIYEAIIPRLLSAKEIGEKLGINFTKLYYHLNLMEKAGIIKVEDERIVSGITEKYYRAIAKRMQIAPNLLSSGTDREKQSINQVLLSTLETTEKDIERSLHAQYAELEEDTNVIFISRQLSYLTDEQANEFYEKLNSLIKEYESENSGNSDMQSFALMIAFYPSYYFEH